MQNFDGFATKNSLMHADTMKKPDFSGWATKANLQCSDGRTIMPHAFRHQDAAQVPLVWQHTHNDPANVLGHVRLENRDEGVYCYGYFNESAGAINAKTLVQHDDIKGLSIFANQLVEKAKQVSHGIIREVSLVLAGANPGALIDNIELAHADGEMVTLEDEAVIYTGLELEHEDKTEKKDDKKDDVEHADKTIQDIYDSMTDDQKNVVHYMVGAALEGVKHDNAKPDPPKKDDEEVVHDDSKKGPRMTRNAFEEQKPKEDEKHVLSHDALKGIVEDAQRVGSLKEAVETYALKHGIENIDILFPEARNVSNTPEWDARRTEWVAGVINGTKHSPFSRIKSLVADLTHEEARARGYIKGNLKKEEFFGLAKRVTTPSTIYKKQKLDRDDIIDIVDLDVVSWLKGEMRLMLDEEIARAVLIGDGRAVDDEDKIRDPAGSNEGAGIRSILHDNDLYAATINLNLDDANSTPTEAVDAVLGAMQFYKGSGSPTFYTTLKTLTYLILARDAQGRRYYRTASDVASELGVSSIVTVEVMEQEPDLVGIIVNLSDYTIGADRGGEVSMFDDFDIDYNQYKYLIETRLSGALTKIRSALVIKRVAGSDVLRTPAAPTFDAETGDIVVPTATGMTYKRADTNADVSGTTITLDPGESLKIYATATSGSYFANNVQDEWTFDREA